MATYTNLADYSSEGFNIGKDAKVLAYLHGLSDFWVFMFDDASKINTMMEANAIVASDIYNKFLQLTSTISLEGVGTLTNSQLKLLLISEDDAVPGKVETYKFPEGESFQYAKCLSNRAFLPTTTLENETDYLIDGAASTISFAKPLSGSGFPFRTLESGKKQYALWAIDAKVDDRLIYDYYGKLLDINPTTSTDNFKNFVYGMYYLFVNGPNLETIRRGLNIALGIPLARDTETVLEIRRYLNSDQWLVVTDLNSYLIPYGLAPTVAVDDQLSSGKELASWIEVKDYESNGEWWINFMLPDHLLPHVPTSIPGGSEVNADSDPDRYMTKGSYADYLMRNYLKAHTFLVNVQTKGFKNIQSFEKLFDIIREVKPSYTTPIYVWTVPIDEEVLGFLEDFRAGISTHRCEDLTDGIARFTRNDPEPHTRDTCPLFIRMTVPGWVDDIMGRSEDINGTPKPFQGGTLNGFINHQFPFRTPTSIEAGWDRALRTRGASQYVPQRGLLDYNRSRTLTGDGEVEFPYNKKYPGYRMIALHTTTLKDVQEKFTACNQVMPSTYLMPLFEPGYILMDLIDANAIDDYIEDDWYDFIVANFDFLFNKGTNGRYLGGIFPEASNFVYVPEKSEVTRGDFFIFTRIDATVCGAYWMTRNASVQALPYDKHDQPDKMTVMYTCVPSRAGAIVGHPRYHTRGVDVTTYGDQNNIEVSRDRSGRTLNTNRTFK